AFVAIGRASHSEGDALAGLARTAWPFLAGLAVGWLCTRAWRRPAALVPTGLGVWITTVGLGLGLRGVSGQGTAAGLLAGALAVWGLFLLGWRLIAGRLATSS